MENPVGLVVTGGGAQMKRTRIAPSVETKRPAG
jgi:hypothetical protein